MLHPLLLGALSLPALLPAALRARSLDLADLQAAVLTTPVMTACAVIGRLVAITAAVAALAALGRIATRLAGRRVGRWAEAIAAVNLSVAYYGRTTNLDGPALMWTALAVERLVRAGGGGTEGDRSAARELAGFAMCAAASVATKDQAYASYVLLIPFFVVAMALTRRSRLGSGGAPTSTATSTSTSTSLSLAAVARAAGLGALDYGLASGAFLNPTGFLTRVRTLGGSASDDYRVYARTAAGVAANLYDLFVAQPEYWWPRPIVVLAWAGVALVLAAVVGTGGRDQRIWRLAPLLAGLGSLVGFTLIVGRAEHRFVLPLGFWLAFYAAIALERMRTWLGLRGPRLAGAITGIGGGLVGLALLTSLSLVITQWRDGRRAVESWLATRPRGTTVETYGPLVYLPRFQSQPRAPYRVTRVGPEDIIFRNPLAGVDERQERIADALARRTDVLIVSEGFALPYLLPEPASDGRVLPAVTRRARQDLPTLSSCARRWRTRCPGIGCASSRKARVRRRSPSSGSTAAPEPGPGSGARHQPSGVPPVMRDGRGRAIAVGRQRAWSTPRSWSATEVRRRSASASHASERSSAQ